MENYFEFYGIPISFQLDAKQVRKIYYANSKKYHPDFYTLASAEKQAEALELSSLNNKAYELFGHSDALIKYILELKGVLIEGQAASVPPMFLMEMMDINEEMESLELNFESDHFKQIKGTVETLENDLFDQIKDILEDYSDVDASIPDLEKVKDYYLKKQYLLRIKEKLFTFASQ